MPSRFVVPPVAALLLCGLGAAPAWAQEAPRAYLAAVTGILIIDADHVEGSRPLAGVAWGRRIRSWADLEVEIDLAPGTVTREFTGPLIAFGPPSTTFEEFESRAVIARVIQSRETAALLSIGVALHAPSAPRFRPRAFVGLSGHRMRDGRRIEVLSLPPGVTQAEVDRALPAEPPRTRTVGGLTLGGGVEIAIRRNLSVTPDVRYDYGSVGDEINNALRVTARLAWRF
jgi:hypothetical protein